MSIFDNRANRFDTWLPAEHARRGDFTLMVVLVSIEGASIRLLRSTFMNVIGVETGWSELRALFGQSGTEWNAAAFFAADDGLLPNALARIQLRELEEQLRADRRILNQGHFFDDKGRRLKVEERS